MRVVIHEVRLSIVVAAPVIWAGLELAQAHLLTGINIATPGHSQYRWIELIQISDLCGGYGVSFVIVLVAACLAAMMPVDAVRRMVAAGASDRGTCVPRLYMATSAPRANIFGRG